MASKSSSKNNDDNSEDKMARKGNKNTVVDEEFTALRRLLQDTLLSFPQNGYKHFESFFVRGGTASATAAGGTATGSNAEDGRDVDELALENVRKAWARAMVKAQAFTKVNANTVRGAVGVSDPVTFAEDVIGDLSLGQTEYARTVRKIGTLLSTLDNAFMVDPSKPEAQSKHGKLSTAEIYSALSSVVHAGDELNRLQSMLNSSGLAGSEQMFKNIGEESIIEFRHWARKIKFHWNMQSRSNVHYATYVPANLELLGSAETKFGVIASDDHNSVWAVDVDHVCGIRIISKSQNVQSRTMISYDSFTKFTMSRRYNIFPVVFKLERESPATLMVFEAPACRRLSGLLNPLLCSYLFRSPVVMRLCTYCHSYY
jgi:hypothetical protein